MRIGRMMKIRWWIIGLVMIGTILNYLTRSIMGVAAPTAMTELHISTEQYSWITGGFQLGIMLQPVAGYILDMIGLKTGLALFAAAWGVITMAHGLATGWVSLAGLRALLGFAEGTAHPGALKVISEWFPARERGFAGGVYNIGASLGSVLAPLLVAGAVLVWDWRGAFIVAGVLALIWAACWRRLYYSPETHPTVSSEEKAEILEGRESYLRATEGKPPIGSVAPPAQFVGHRPAPIPRRSGLGHADLVDAALSHHRPPFRPRPDRDVRRSALHRRRSRLPVRSGRGAVAATARDQPDQRAARRLYLGRGVDDRHDVRRPGRERRGGGRAALPWRFRAPDAVGHLHHHGVGPVPAERGRHRRRHRWHHGQSRRAALLARHGPFRRDDRLWPVLRRARHSRPVRRRADVDPRPCARTPEGPRDLHDPQSHPAWLQPRPVDRPCRRGLLYRDLDLRMVPRRADPSFARPGKLDSRRAAAGAGEPARHARRSGQLRRLGALPDA